MVRKRKRRWRSGEIRVFLAIILICLLVAAGLHFFMDRAGAPSKATDVTERDLQRMERLLEAHGKRIDADRLKRIKETYGDKIGDAELEKLRETYGEKMERGDLEKLMKTHR